ncbi:MAG TPA: chromosome segregation protein SMC [Longimicrobiaceae bacterium]|nr:chromosome segregation protein SMC [Longimicrobiaceae bacterium]
MKLKSLRLQGFKSFADRTTLDFREGVTAIIGSNGCGKSNIADAIRWVLGEQRASAMRGAKMEEVIFQGTTRRRPLHYAEVSLLFDNESGRVPAPHAEIEVTRKVFREGGSEYSLNRTACRLRDIHNLLRDTGLGSNAYAIIEAGMIETLLSDRAEERRMLFEEAAGIGRYKDSRQAATRRLDAAQADLDRLQDLIAEVESKVRGLARQRRRAERHRELLARRLQLEAALARADLSGLETDLAGTVQRRAEVDESARASAAERATVEARIEERRAEVARLTNERLGASAQLDRLRADLDGRERELLLADERRSHAELRIQQIVRERAELEARRTALASDALRHADERSAQAGRLEALRARLDSHAEESRSLRDTLASERASSDRAVSRARELARETATLEGERASAQRRHHEADDRLAELAGQERSLRRELERAAEQTDLFASRSDDLRARVDAAAETAELARERIVVLRGRDQAERDALRAAEDRLSLLSSQVEARELLERGYEGFSPAVASIMAARERFPGVHAPLADFVGGSGRPAFGAEAMERYLGPLLQALVVDDLATARRVRDWFRGEWSGGGSLLLLPLDTLSAATGADWVEALVGGLVVVEDPLGEPATGPRIGVGGDVVDARGVVRLADSGAGEGILARRELLVRLRGELADARRTRQAAAAARDAAREALEAAEEDATEAEEVRRVADAELKRIELESAAQRHHHGRLEQDRERIGRSVAALAIARDDAARRVDEVGCRLAELASETEAAAAEEAAARARLAGLEDRWESAREEETELRVAVARGEAELRETDRRLAAAEQGSVAAGHRLSALEAEAAELRATLEALAGVRERAGGELEALFVARDEAAALVARLDARLGEIGSEVEDLSARARDARRNEDGAAEERHALDLRLADLRSRAERVVERLEVEWGRPWDALLAEAGPLAGDDPEEWRRELLAASEQLDSLGTVNLLAVEEHAEEQRRLDFLLEQRTDLVSARDDLVAAIRQINRTAREVFLRTFDEVRGNFQRVFQSLFQGGECDVRLADPDDPLESPVEIQASPKGKRTQRIHLLSGGERTLTALALLFALYLVKPSPFCVLDEVDAPLDESNVGRFIQLLHDFKAETQFIVITHNARTMEAADWVYGVTMEEPGVSTIVGVQLDGGWRLDEHSAVNT